MVTCRSDRTDPQKQTGEPPDPNVPVETEREAEPGPGPNPDPRWSPERDLEPVGAR